MYTCLFPLTLPLIHSSGPELASPDCMWNVSEWNRALAPLAPLVRNSTATPQFMGSLHPRLKAPVGRRLAAGMVATEYGGGNTVTGPTLSGCTYDDTAHRITLHFNKTLLKGDVVTITRTQVPIPANSTVATPVTDSLLTHVCTGDAHDCSCLSWRYTPTGKHTPKNASGWTCEVPFASDLPPGQLQQSRGDIWAEAPITLLDDGASIAVDTARLNVTTGGVQAVSFGWSFDAGSCCIDLPSQTGLAPCIPGR